MRPLLLALLAAPVTLVVDRIEGAYAVVEVPDGRLLDVPYDLLPPGTREGDRVRMRVHGARLVAPLPFGRLHGAARPAGRAASQPGARAPNGGRP
jgi:hypothetical protein